MVAAVILIVVFGLMFAICRKYHKRVSMTVWDEILIVKSVERRCQESRELPRAWKNFGARK